MAPYKKIVTIQEYFKVTVFEENVYTVLNQYSYKISSYKKHAFLPYASIHYSVSEETPFFFLLLNLRYPLIP